MDIPTEGLIFLTYPQFKLLFSSCIPAWIQLITSWKFFGELSDTCTRDMARHETERVSKLLLTRFSYSFVTAFV